VLLVCYANRTKHVRIKEKETPMARYAITLVADNADELDAIVAALLDSDAGGRTLETLKVRPSLEATK